MTTEDVKPRRKLKATSANRKKLTTNYVKRGGQTQKNTTKQQPMYCSPARHDMGLKDNTCLTTTELKDIARDYNRNVVGNTKKEKPNSVGKSTTLVEIKIVDSKKQLFEALKEKLGPTCGNADHCWIQQDFVQPATRNRLLSKAFRPLKPREWYINRQTWLNTYDIQKVMQQYEEKYKDFVFLGVFPIDFASNDEYGQCISQEMCSFGLRKVLQVQKKRFGMVLNLDRHDQSGSHWVALYCNMQPKRKNFGIYYYDSVGHPPPREVASFMTHMEKESHDLFSKKVADRFVMRYNRVQKQFSNYDCGVFAEVFLTQMLKEIRFDDICQKMPTDAEVNKLRDVLYTPVRS